MVHVHTVEGSDETDFGGGESVADKPRCTCNLSPETQDLLKQVFQDIVSIRYIHVTILLCVGMLC